VCGLDSVGSGKLRCRAFVNTAMNYSMDSDVIVWSYCKSTRLSC